MRRPRVTIARWMGLIAILALNAGLVRAFVAQEMFYGGILIFIALQVGLSCLLRSRGRVRRFWLGFEISGVAAVLVLFSCEVFPDSALNRLLMTYTDISASLASSHLPTPLADHLDEHWDLFLAVVYFVPEITSALVGGTIAVSLRRMTMRSAVGPDQPVSRSGAPIINV
jgi:hypothetical protein